MNKRGIGVRNRLSGIIMTGGIVAAGFGLAGFGAGDTSALDLSISTPSDPILEVSLSSNLVQLDITPSLGAADFKTANLTVTAGTNNVTGYTLYMDVDSPNLTRTEATTDNTTPIIPSLESNAQGYTEANFTANSWGYRVGSGNYLAIPTENLTLSSSLTPSNSDSAVVTFASKVDMSQPAGSYSTDVDIIAIANPILELQDVGTWEGSITTGQVIKAKDTRDNKYYTISRLLDGRLWFLDNLTLDLTDTDVQSNLTAATTNASTISLGYLKNGGGTTSDQYATSGVANWTSDVSYSDPLINMESENIIPSNAPVNSYGTNKTGGYYNYCAASAGSYCYGDGSGSGVSTGNATEDICPAGWRLPTGDANGEYSTLANAIYGSTDTTSDATAVADFRTALSAPLAGRYANESANYQGTDGYFWSSTRYDDKYMYFLFVSTSNVIPANSFYRAHGHSVRCIAKRSSTKITFNANGGTGTMSQQVFDETNTGTLQLNAFTREGYAFTGWNTAADGSGTSYTNGATYTGASTTLYAQWEQRIYIQDVTMETCPTVRTLVYDSRDENPYYIQKIDSLCWMTSNLNIAGGTTLTSEKSNVSGDYTLPVSSIAGFNDSDKAFVYNDSTYGGYYSWVAATAGTNQSTYDICPKGWKLPSQANYDTLRATYTLTAAPWYGVYGGLYGSGSASNVGSDGRYWSSTAYALDYVYYLYFNSSSANTLFGAKSSGFSVRCIKK